MAYTILNNDGTVLLRLADGTIDSTTTSLTFVGRDVPGYGQYYNQNLEILLTNSANPNFKPPSNPIQGQLWYDNTYRKLRIFDGDKFITAGGATISPQPPAGMTAGDFWYDTTNELLNYFTGYQYNTVYSYPVGETTGWLFTRSIVDRETNVVQQVTLLENWNVVLGAISNSTFTTTDQDSANPLRFYQANTSSYLMRQGLNIFGDIAATGTIYAGSLNIEGIAFTGALVAGGNITGQTLNIFSTATMGPINSTGTIFTTGLVKGASGEFDNIRVSPGLSSLSNVVAWDTTVTNLTASTATITAEATIKAARITTNLTVTNNLYVGGDLYVDGTQTIINRSVIQSNDSLLYLSSATAPASSTFGSGIAIGPLSTPYASLVFDGVDSFVVTGANATSLRATIVTNRITSYTGSGNITLDPDGTSDVIISNSTNLFVQATDPSGPNTAAAGAVQVSGGVGIAGGLYVGGDITATNVSVSSFAVSGNETIGGSLNVTGNIVGSIVTATHGFNVTGAFNGSYVSGLLADYSGGVGRLFVGSGETLTVYSNPNSPASMLSVSGSGVTIPNALTVTSQSTLNGGATVSTITATNVIVSTQATFNGNVQAVQHTELNHALVTLLTATNARVTGELNVSGVGSFNGVYSSVVTATGGLYAVGNWAGAYVDGVVIDYSATNGRISVGDDDRLTIYNGGVAGTAMMTISTQSTTILGNFLPTVTSGNTSTYSLGSPTAQWRSLYVSTNTVYIGGHAISVAPLASGSTITTITVNGNAVSGVRSTTSSTPPTNPVVGDEWYNTTNDGLYKYVSDGVSSYWLDISGATSSPPLQGTTGAQGATGTQGANGVQGFVGTQGTTGSGTQGTTGGTGAQGTTGGTGAQGTTGGTGAQGATGTGNQGTTGGTGAQGTTGAVAAYPPTDNSSIGSIILACGTGGTLYAPGTSTTNTLYRVGRFIPSGAPSVSYTNSANATFQVGGTSGMADYIQGFPLRFDNLVTSGTWLSLAVITVTSWGTADSGATWYVLPQGQPTYLFMRIA